MIGFISLLTFPRIGLRRRGPDVIPTRKHLASKTSSLTWNKAAKTD